MQVSAMLILMIFVSACASLSGPPITSNQITARHPLCQELSWHELDTPTTQREIFAHNLKVQNPVICP
jgi:hypothetical protein